MFRRTYGSQPSPNYQLDTIKFGGEKKAQKKYIFFVLFLYITLSGHSPRTEGIGILMGVFFVCLWPSRHLHSFTFVSKKQTAPVVSLVLPLSTTFEEAEKRIPNKYKCRISNPCLTTHTEFNSTALITINIKSETSNVVISAYVKVKGLVQNNTHQSEYQSQ